MLYNDGRTVTRSITRSTEPNLVNTQFIWQNNSGYVSVIGEKGTYVVRR